MSRSIGAALPAELVDRMSARDLKSVASKVIQLFTPDVDGWPHPALLSYFEVIALDAERVRLAAYNSSTTSTNMRRSGQATLVIIDLRSAYYVKGRAAEIAPEMSSAPWNAAFELRVTDVLVDEVDERYEPGAYVASGVTYHNPRRSSELEQARTMLAELRAIS